MRRTESASLALLATLWTTAASGAADAISLSLLEDTYLSSMQGGGDHEKPTGRRTPIECEAVK
jgi:hypothetical protein